MLRQIYMRRKGEPSQHYFPRLLFLEDFFFPLPTGREKLTFTNISKQCPNFAHISTGTLKCEPYLHIVPSGTSYPSSQFPHLSQEKGSSGIVEASQTHRDSLRTSEGLWQQGSQPWLSDSLCDSRLFLLPGAVLLPIPPFPSPPTCFCSSLRSQLTHPVPYEVLLPLPSIPIAPSLPLGDTHHWSHELHNFLPSWQRQVHLVPVKFWHLVWCPMLTLALTNHLYFSESFFLSC